MASVELQQVIEQLRAQRANPQAEVDLATRRKGMDAMASPVPDDVTRLLAAYRAPPV